MFNIEQRRGGEGNLLTDPKITFTNEKSLYSFISKIMLDEEIDFVAGPVISQWHAIGVDALAYSIFQHENRRPSGVIIIAHYPEGLRISEVDFVCNDFATVKFCFLKVSSSTHAPFIYRNIRFIKRGISFLLAMLAIRDNTVRQGQSGKRKVRLATIAQPQVGLLQLFRNKRLAGKYYPAFALIDEGTGSYASEKAWAIVRELASRGKGMWRLGIIRVIETKIIGISSRLIEIIAGKYIEIENRQVFHKERNELIPNISVVNSYKSVIEKRAKVYGEIERNGPLAVLITTPYSEYGLVSLASELDLAEAVINILVKKGFDIIIKPHPAENANKYGPVLTKFKPEQVRLSYHKMPVESLVAALHPACVIGYTSTSLVMAKTMYNIPAITIIDILIGRADTEYQWTGAHDFKGNFTGEICYNADTFNKLKQVLSSIKLNNGGA